MVRWQLAKRQAGTHKVKTRSETSYSTKKIYRQKGTGGARHGDRNAPIFRGGGTYKGPTPRSHAHDLQKGVRKLGLKMALSAKAKAGELIVVEDAKLASRRPRFWRKRPRSWGWQGAGDRRRPSWTRTSPARSAISTGLDLLPSTGANVYDILRKDKLVVTKAGLEALEARLK